MHSGTVGRAGRFWLKGLVTHGLGAVGPYWANFQYFWWQSFLQKQPKYLVTFWVILKKSNFEKNYCGYLLATLEKCQAIIYSDIWSHCGQSYKHFTSVNYDPRVVIWAISQSYDSRVINYDCKVLYKIDHSSRSQQFPNKIMELRAR